MKKQFKPPKLDLIKYSPYAIWFPNYAEYCKPDDISKLHKHYCSTLDVPEILETLNWRFEKRFVATLGQAEYWEDEETGKPQYLIRYASKYWATMGADGRKNTIAHEICHLAVEKLFGHGSIDAHGIKVTDHGYHWKLLMHKCGEDPNFDTKC